MSAARPQQIKLSYREQLRHFLACVEEEETRNMSRPWSLSPDLEDTLRHTFEDVKFEWEDLDGTRWAPKDPFPENRLISLGDVSYSKNNPRSIVTERAPAPTTLEPSPVISDSTEATALGDRTNGRCLESHNLSLIPTSARPRLSRTSELRDFPYIDGESSKVFSRPSVSIMDTIGANSHNVENPMRTPPYQLGPIISFGGSDLDFDENPDTTRASSHSLCPETPKRAKSTSDENGPLRAPTSRPRLTRTPSYRQVDFEDDESDRIFSRLLIRITNTEGVFTPQLLSNPSDAVEWRRFQSLSEEVLVGE
ncbi:hypothetical protein PQX77_014398 [Marasmius sp. AFHP31]|nr:hypothetical protein PQX77_014398 [Marasmius sp. AFHP31]